MADMIGFTVEGEEGILKTLQRLVAPGAYVRGLRRIGQRVIDEAGMYPPVKRVTRKQAYGQTFQSDKQRRWFFSALRSGTLTLPYSRTAAVRSGWKLVEQGLTVSVTNSAPGAKYVHGEETQARMMTLIGWRKLSEIVEAVNTKGGVIEIMKEEVEKEMQ